MSELEDLKLLHNSWDEVVSLVTLITGQIKECNYDPDIIIAMSRGGFSPARILCDHLNIKRLASIQIEYYTGIGTTKKTPHVIFPLNADVEGLNVLIVDDVADTGHSLRLAIEQIQKNRPQTMKTATIHTKPWSSLKPDFCALEVNKWIVYPWEVVESLNSVIRMLKKAEINGIKVRDRLLSLGFKSETIDEHLSSYSNTYSSSS
jgi:hypoxanthine phosphoribosyltransferase